MKTDLHPDYKFVTVKLVDGTEYTTRSTMTNETYVSEIDSSNHPFYTGKKTMVDTAGRVERFRRRYGNQHAQQVSALEAETAKEEAAKVDVDSVEAQAAAQEAVKAAPAAQAVDADAPAPETKTADGEQDGLPVPGTGKPPASSPENPARDTEKTDPPLPATAPEV